MSDNLEMNFSEDTGEWMNRADQCLQRAREVATRTRERVKIALDHNRRRSEPTDREPV